MNNKFEKIYKLKIRIVGSPGSGKTYISNIISKKLNTKAIDLDEIFWNMSSTGNRIKNDYLNRESELNSILLNTSWIIEGVYINPWTFPTFSEADYILVIKTNKWTQYYRLFKRFFIRKFTNYRPKETLKDFKNLISWSFQYQKNLDDFIFNNSYSNKIITIKTSKDLTNFLNLFSN
ncbi:DNA topology modulation protein FlaR [Cetobacterium sp. 8H]|uniref:P-loop NTPase fold protein n=1 Tax=Cetobacterium sp. 8H TaxID=2759681 RepID=UPI00163CBB68|nr:P-loop NTPase fold protein [Cetobacterium sp. 8H]MBC2850345.1 DNA topology modulation protein FlaR [Cetobacterium sp. 8H]